VSTGEPIAATHEPGAGSAAKAPYHPPGLRRLGSLEDLTQGAGPRPVPDAGGYAS
jgi:hypothetical protein